MRVRMTVAYDGSGFHGFAAQAVDLPTVAATLTRALERRLGHPVALVVAGRTDAGVHAWGQVVSFDAAVDGFDAPRLQDSLNRALGPKVVVRSVEVAPSGFDARRSARSRRYRYTVLNRRVPDPFLAATTWHVAEPLDLGALRLACDPVIGEHDFTSFCRQPKHRDGSEPSLVRRVHRAGWTDLGDGILRFEIAANAFCHQMIRSIVGTLVDVGLGRKHAGEIMGILVGRDRSKASALAPPQGLCLYEVGYAVSG